MDAHDRVACTRLRCTLAAGACATRHAARIPSGGGRGAPKFYPCHACPDGAAVLAELEAGGWTRPGDSLPAIVFEPAQMQARERWRRSYPIAREPGDALERDPVREVARWTPDDVGAGVDAG